MNKRYMIFVIIILLIVLFSGCVQQEAINSDDPDFKEDEQINDNGNDNGHPQETYADSDGDGYYNYEDAFPYDSTEWKDSDNDGHGDNNDAFPYNSLEWIDTDNDGHGDNSDVFPYDSSEWADSDYDGYGDKSDAFPYDSTEWLDSDGDGTGDNSDPYPYDYDNDGYPDSVDINKYRDVAIKVSFEKFMVVDEVDPWPLGNAEVYFEVYINEIMKGRIDYNGESFVVSIGQTKVINDYFVFNIPDNQRYTDIRIVMWDDDYIFGRELIDIDGHDDSKGLSIVFDAIAESWSGDTSGSSDSWGDIYVDGRDDGIESWLDDDNDGVLWYNIFLVEVEYDKTYSWNYNWEQWTLHINIPREILSQYKHSGVDRNPSLYETSKIKAFVTSNDAVIMEIANKLNSLADTKGFNYYETVNLGLKFVQSLKYTSDNISVGPDDYWRFSVETLVDETGDCEDTSILFASIMEAMGYDAVLFLLPTHVAVGILGNDGYSGTYITYSGQRYYYCETTASDTGWSIYNMGDMPPEYQQQSPTIIQVE